MFFFSDIKKMIRHKNMTDFSDFKRSQIVGVYMTGIGDCTNYDSTEDL